MSTPAAIANGRSFRGFFSSAAAKPTLFQASIEKSEPTVAAPITGRSAGVSPSAGQNPAPKFAAPATAFRPMVSPSRISAASAAVLTVVKLVCTIAAVRTPRTLTQVSSTIERIANTRWGEKPTMSVPIGCGRVMVVPKPGHTSGLSAGTSTDVNRANATATAAIVPVWITTNRVHP